MPKVTKNLLLDEEAVARGERYSERHQTNLSRLVSDFLARLPLDPPPTGLTPAVGRLLGVGAPNGVGSADRADYRAHLVAKYGATTRRKRR